MDIVCSGCFYLPQLTLHIVAVAVVLLNIVVEILGGYSLVKILLFTSIVVAVSCRLCCDVVKAE